MNHILKEFLSNGTLQLEVSNVCNIKCFFCANPHLLAPKGVMNFDCYRTILGNIQEASKEIHSVTICGYGEPFCNPDVYKIIRDLAEHGISVYVQTNGKWVLEPSNASALFKAAHISFTIDGITNEVFNKSRPDTDVNRIWENLRYVILQKEQGRHQTSISVRMNVFQFNRHEVNDLVARCLKMNVDHVDLGRGYAEPASLMTTITPEELESYSENILSIQPELVRQTDAYARDNGHNDSARPGVLTNNLFYDAGCPGVTIRWNGNVTPCCYDHNVTVPMGNLMVQSIEDILSRQNIRQISEMIIKDHNRRVAGGVEIMCDNCNYLTNYLTPPHSDHANSQIQEDRNR